MPPTYKKAEHLEQLYYAIVQLQMCNTYYEVTEVETQKKKLRLKTETSQLPEECVVKEKKLKKNNEVLRFISGMIIQIDGKLYALTETQSLIHNIKGVNLIKLKFIVEYGERKEIITLEFPYTELVETEMIIKEAYSMIDLTRLLNQKLQQYNDIIIYYTDFQDPIITNEKFLTNKQMLAIHYMQLIEGEIVSPVIRASQLIHDQSTIFDLYRSPKEYYLMGSPVFIVENLSFRFIGFINQFKESYLQFFHRDFITFS